MIERKNYMVYMPTRRCMSRRGKINLILKGEKHYEAWRGLHLSKNETTKLSKGAWQTPI